MEGARLDADANVLAGPIPIATFTSPASTAVAYSSAANIYLVAWGESGDIHGQRLSSTGSQQDGANGFIISNATDAQTDPSVTFTGTTFVVAWSDRRSGSAQDIYTARVDTGGSVLDSNGVSISPHDGADSLFPQTTFDGMESIMSIDSVTPASAFKQSRRASLFEAMSSSEWD